MASVNPLNLSPPCIVYIFIFSCIQSLNSEGLCSAVNDMEIEDFLSLCFGFVFQ